MHLTTQDFESLAANRFRKEYNRQGLRAVLFITIALIAFLVVDSLHANNFIRYIFALGFLVSVAYYVRIIIQFSNTVKKAARDLKILAMGEGVTVE